MCLMVVQNLGVDPVELQNQSVEQCRVHPLVPTQELGVPLEKMITVIINVWPRMMTITAAQKTNARLTH